MTLLDMRWIEAPRDSGARSKILITWGTDNESEFSDEPGGVSFD